MQSSDAGDGTVNDARKFAADFRAAVLQEALLCFLGAKPGGMPIRFLRSLELRYLAKMDNDCQPGRRRSSSGRPRVLPRRRSIGFVVEVAGECHRLYPSMNPGLFKGLLCRGLRGRKSGFDSPLGENPTAAASLNQQKFYPAFADSVADGGNLLPLLSTHPPGVLRLDQRPWK